MGKHSKLALWLIAFTLLIVGGVRAQLQQSGGPGSTVTLQTGSAIAGKFGIDQTTPGTTNGVQVNAALPAGANSIGNLGTVTAVTAITNALPAGTNVIGTVNTIPKTSCGNTLATGSALAAVPTSSTLLTSAVTACVVAAIFNNTTASALTISLTDNTATPINSLLTFSIPANSSLVQPLWGSSFNLGVKWTSSGAGITGSVVAYQ